MAATKDDLASLPTLLGSSNYPMWSCRLTAFLTYKKLFAVVTVDPGPRPTQAVKDQLTFLVIKLETKYTTESSPLPGTPMGMPYGLKLHVSMVQTQPTPPTEPWPESCLAEFASIGKVHEEGTICGTIIAKISIKRPGVTDPLLMNDVLMNNSEMLIEKLKDLASHEEMVHKNPHAEKHANAFNSNGRTRPKPGCKNGSHNPQNDHPLEQCWGLHPDLRPIRGKPRNKTATSNNVTAEDAPPSQSTSYDRPAFAHCITAYSFSAHGSQCPPVLDSGASHHMFNDLAFFHETTVCNIPINTGKGTGDLTATRKGTAQILQSTGKTLMLEDALFVPGMARNLISLCRLTNSFVSINRKGNRHSVNVDGHVHFTCNMVNGILEFEEDIGPVSHFITALSTTTHSHSTSPFLTWHTRLGHASIARIKAALPDVSLNQTDTCGTCMKGKVTKIPFKGHFDQTSHALEVVHGDLVGPITPSTNSGAKYFLTLVDQHTGFISVTLLKDKSQAAEGILDFKTFFETQTGNKMKKLITDGGGEFCNNSLSESLKEHGIQHNVAPPYTPQHNGVAERANRTSIINMGRCILLQSGLAKEWWGEAVKTAMSTTNCLPSLSRSKTSPLEQMFKKVPNLRFFKPFGCKAWTVKPKQLRGSKFDPIAWEGVMIGYSNDYSCYRIVKLEDKKVIETRHAYFDESIFPSLKAINPSLDAFPHSILPDFAAPTILPFPDSPRSTDNHEEMDLDEVNEDVSGAQNNHHEDADMDEGPAEPRR
ncbi:hypothetical protein MJO29_004549 [Puccinia striiformis f. sp. tritici]|nr:hypothetical protein MJO29_004549 [Puccinia striiformis f. sp. tritici]